MNDENRQAVRELVVLSGKGGTGKTTVTASLAVLAHRDGIRAVSVDCDVDASNLYLVLSPTDTETRDYSGGSIAVVDQNKCTGCGVCQPKCMFEAMVGPGEVDPYACEGCGVCALVCPEKAITLKSKLTGSLHRGSSEWGGVVWAALLPGAGNSGKLASEVREEARSMANAQGATLIISDGPPGLGCPVISSLTGTDLALLVTEPSVSGLHDLDRIADLCAHFGVPVVVAINKADLNPERAEAIRSWCLERDLPLLAEIPFDPQVPASITQGKPLVAAASGRSPAVTAIHGLWQRLKETGALGI